ncbi:AbrB/MazE/SpoVT family DNA-binding domain-containing protein [Caballeronia sp. LZ035]|uniref:AbrB/MazE/SpoVT family DNA-binding domain-containing protein n=1 Tax=Caballeronia sp. LZ035 TaxID=3038568 RepID=UPI002866FA88|nr:AbrB/MazE/SpoVT family DNA-binding domain-containing protein [Caballeronia sp. LZ035]MDR5756228.1 AbrB/MazE/SpoVT family DNA-binding domain-containing protein [Caballeronia sp. LZ035]
MNLLIAKWGDSLAVRIPAEYLHHAGMSEGDQIQANLTVDGGICLHPGNWDRKAFLKEIAQTRDRMPMTDSVIDELRREARY